ncbi:hypothetical protein BCR36DRAFT_264837, partial [Piromyces finnis]
SQGYSCCSSDCVTIYSDVSGNWGVENGDWCGCINKPNTKCSSKILALGYSCCADPNCEVYFQDESGDWGYESDWCGCG